MALASVYTIDLSAICVFANGVSPDTPCAVAVEMFVADAKLPAIAVLDKGGAPAGIAHRQTFLSAFADADGRALFAKAPISRLMDSEPLIVERAMPLDQLSSDLLEGENANQSAAFIVVDEGAYFGLGSTVGLLRIVTDHLRTQALEADATRREAEAAAESKGRFLANMTHELRTPLNGVIGFGRLLESEAHGPLGAQEYKLYAKDIVDSGKHLLAIINDILDLAKIEAGRIELHERFIDLRELAGRSLRMVATLAANKEITLRNCNIMQHWMVRADERRLQQALINLLSNAIKFTPRGGEVGLEFGMDAGWVWIEVWDAGCGIEQDDLDRLFKPFEQLQAAEQQEGTGLGLTITRALMRSHGGDVELESAINEGTRVKLLLPRNRLLAEEFTWSAHSKVEFIDPLEGEDDEEAYGVA